MDTSQASPNTRPIFLYFGSLTLLVYLVAPEYLLDIPTSYMLKNHLHATAPQVSMFRLLTGIPVYVAFLFGMARDLWSPFGLRDRGVKFNSPPVWIDHGALAGCAFCYFTDLDNVQLELFQVARKK